MAASDPSVDPLSTNHTSGRASCAAIDATLSTATPPPFQLTTTTAISDIDAGFGEEPRVERRPQDAESVQRRERPAHDLGQQQMRQNRIAARDLDGRKEPFEQCLQPAFREELDVIRGEEMLVRHARALEVHHVL